MTAPVYEPVGTITATAKSNIDAGDGTILVKQDDEYLIAQPAPNTGGDA